MKTISFNVSFNVTFEFKDGWWYAKSSNGDSTSSVSKDDCLRILTERAKDRAGVSIY